MAFCFPHPSFEYFLIKISSMLVVCQAKIIGTPTSIVTEDVYESPVVVISSDAAATINP